MSLRFILASDLSLEAVQSAHAAPLARGLLDHHDDLRVWLPFVDALDPAQPDVAEAAMAALVDTWTRRANAGQALHLVIRHRGELAGVVGFEELSFTHRRAELGWWVTPPHRGQGVIRRATTALLDHAFGMMALHRVEAWCDVDNLVTRTVVERLGFRVEGIAQERRWQADRWIDEACYAQLAQEWARR